VGVVVEAHLDEHIEWRSLLAGHGVGQGGHKLGPIDRVHDVGVSDDVPGLVGLQSPDEMPGRPWQIGHARHAQ
jgi:hypothetical protein